MDADVKSLLIAWQTNCRINHTILDAIKPAALHCTLSVRGGRGVSGEFAHMHNIRLAQLQRRAKALAEGVIKLDPSSKPTKTVLRKALKQSDKAIGGLLEGIAEGKPKHRGARFRGFKRGLFTTLSYFISHEAHHRGRILLTLKVSKQTIDRDVQMGIWSWDQI